MITTSSRDITGMRLPVVELTWVNYPQAGKLLYSAPKRNAQSMHLPSSNQTWFAGKSPFSSTIEKTTQIAVEGISQLVMFDYRMVP